MKTSTSYKKARVSALPPVVGYPLFKRAVAQMKAREIPDRITYGSFLGHGDGIRSQLAKAFRYLGLVDEVRAPTDALEKLIAANGTRSWGGVLGPLLERAYSPVFEQSKQPYSKPQLTELFSTLYDGNGPSHVKAVRFLYYALQDSGLFDICDAPNERRRRVAPKNGASNASSVIARSQQTQSTSSDQAVYKEAYRALMNDVYDPHSMPVGSTEEKAVFVLARFLKTRL